jgi:DNA-binding NarL/FixJ family response regulator
MRESHNSNTRHGEASKGYPTTMPGVLLLSSSRSVVYVTPLAQALLTHLHDRPSDPDQLPPAVHSLCDELQRSLRHCISPKDWRQIQIHRMVYTLMQSISLRGFVIQDNQSRLLILIEAVTDAMGKVLGSLAADCQLTARQQSIAHGLVRGLTNKELANELNISTHTVKEYVRVIMNKVHATTRTGIVARLSGLIDKGEPLSQQFSPPGRPVGSRQWL